VIFYLKALFLKHNPKHALSFITRFNLEKTEIEEPSDYLIYSAIYHGLLTKELVMRKVVRKSPSNLQELMNKVEEFINKANVNR
jgi:hypothetical protein